MVLWVLGAVAVSHATAVLAKRLVTGRWYGSGGMPSVHDATVVSLAAAILLYEGASTAFAVALTVAAIVVYDSFHVRRAVGAHAAFLNRKFKQRFQEHQGHTFKEAAAGSAIGILIPLLMSL